MEKMFCFLSKRQITTVGHGETSQDNGQHAGGTNSFCYAPRGVSSQNSQCCLYNNVVVYVLDNRDGDLKYFTKSKRYLKQV